MKETSPTELLASGRFSKCELCAYHEAGHILFAYFCGYSCLQAALVQEGDETDFTSVAIIDYGKDEQIAARFMSGEQHLDFFLCQALAEKMESLEIGRRLMRIFLGGSVAAAVYNNGGNVHIPLPMQIDYTDLQRVEFIQKVVSRLSTDQEDDFIEHGLRDALYTLGNGNIWSTVSDLAERLLERNQLDKNDIEECLDEHGIFYGGESPMDAGSE